MTVAELKDHIWRYYLEPRYRMRPRRRRRPNPPKPKHFGPVQEWQLLL